MSPNLILFLPHLSFCMQMRIKTLPNTPTNNYKYGTKLQNINKTNKQTNEQTQLTGLGAKLKTTEGEVEKWRLDLSKVLLEMQSKDSELQHCKKQFTQLQQVSFWCNRSITKIHLLQTVKWQFYMKLFMWLTQLEAHKL